MSEEQRSREAEKQRGREGRRTEQSNYEIYASRGNGDMSCDQKAAGW